MCVDTCSVMFRREWASDVFDDYFGELSCRVFCHVLEGEHLAYLALVFSHLQHPFLLSFLSSLVGNTLSASVWISRGRERDLLLFFSSRGKGRKRGHLFHRESTDRRKGGMGTAGRSPPVPIVFKTEAKDSQSGCSIDGEKGERRMENGMT